MVEIRYDRTTDATVEPVSLLEIMDHCRVTSHDEAAYLQGLVKKARQYVESLTQRQFISATWKAYMDALPSVIELAVLPVSAVSSIVYVDLAGASQTLSATSYQTDILAKDRLARIMPAYGYSWPDTRTDTFNAVTVTFTAGYGSTAASVPTPAKHLIQLLAGYWYDQREPVNVGNIVNQMPFAIENLLSQVGWGQYA